AWIGSAAFIGRLVDDRGEMTHCRGPSQPGAVASRGLPQRGAARRVEGQRCPCRGELRLGAGEYTGPPMLNGVAQARNVEADGRGATQRRLGDHDPPALDQRWV